MADNILRRRMEKMSLDRWENEGGKFFAERIDSPEKQASSDSIKEKNVSQMRRDDF